MTVKDVRIREARWPDDEPAIRTIRETVFVIEQRVDPDLEWDGLDDACLHLLAVDMQDTPLATARMQADGKIGRMAVLRDWRGRGIGRAMLEQLVEAGRQRGLREVYLHAQTRALGFYAAQGFIAEGEPFEEANISHRNMVLRF